jgi:hypothetical protein
MARTTVILDESLLKRIRDMATKRHGTLKDTIVELLQLGMNAKKTKARGGRLSLRTFRSGGASVPIHDRNALFTQMDREA